MAETVPFSDAELAAGLDLLDQPWPRVKMERRFLYRRDVPITPPYPVPMTRMRPDTGDELMVYVPMSELLAIVEASRG